MSDIIDIQNALAGVIASAVYPNGTGAASVSGNPIMVYPGWPNAPSLDADLIAGKAHVTIFPTATEKNTTRYPKDWIEAVIVPATLTAVAVGQTVTISGVMPAPFAAHNIVIVAGSNTYPYSVQPADTLGSIATALAALVAVDIAGTVSAGSVVTLPNTAVLKAARVGVTGTTTREIRRQERVFQITAWTNSPTQRDTIGGAIDAALSLIGFLSTVDGYGARLIYRSSMITDDLQKARLYRRDFMYSVEYATVQTAVNAQITQEQLGIAVSNTVQYPAARITNF